MLKIVLEVEGMHCGMCETHVNDVVRRVEGVKKVKSSHAKGRTEVVAEDSVNTALIKEAIAKQGYGSQSKATAWEELKRSRMKSTGCSRTRGECHVFSS